MKKLVLGLAAIAVIAMVSAPAMAATQWNFGGMIRYMTFWDQNDAGKRGMTDYEGGGATLKSDGRLQWGNQVNTRIMMWMKSDSLEGFIEMGWDDNAGGNGVWTREYWGKYKFGEMSSITIGQQHQLYSSFISRQAGLVDLNMNGIGTAFRPPTPKITYTYGGTGHLFFIPSGFSFALTKPESEEYMGLGSTDVDTYFPQIQAAYSYYADTWRVKVAGAYQHQEWKNYLGTTKDKSIHSWLFTIDGDISFGPLWLAANATVGQNWGNAGMMNSEFGSSMKGFDLIGSGHFDGNGKWKNTTSVMASVVGAYQLTEALRFELGAGYRYDENKVYEKNSHLWNVYLQAAYTVAPGFEIVPEIGYIDRCKWVDGRDDGYL